jgi:hypothetical protein
MSGGEEPPRRGPGRDRALIGDSELKVAKAYDMLPEDAGNAAQGRSAADNATVRSLAEDPWAPRIYSASPGSHPGRCG